MAGNSDVVLAGARISSMAVDPDNTNIAYAAVASGGEFGPGVYKTSDGGQTWTNVLTATSMNLTALGFPAGTTLASVTDLSLNSHDPTILTIGMGNIGLAGASATAGVWTSQNSGLSRWHGTPYFGGLNPNIQNSTPAWRRASRSPQRHHPRPRHAGQAFGTTNDISTIYVLIAAPPAAMPLSGDNINFGTTLDGAIDATPTETTTFNNTPTLFGLYKNGGESPRQQRLDPRHAARCRRAAPPPTSRRGTTSTSPAWTAATSGRSSSIRPTRTWSTSAARRSTLTMPPRMVEHPELRPAPHRHRRHARHEHAGSEQADQGFLNNGDDIQKRDGGLRTLPDEDNFEYPTPNEQGYLGEGVSWIDLSTNAFNNEFSFGGSNIPPNITSVAIDAQNRIVFGTEQGLYRLVYQGTGYDFTSGRTGHHRAGRIDRHGAFRPPPCPRPRSRSARSTATCRSPT